MTISIIKKEDLRTRTITRDKEEQFYNDTKKSLLRCDSPKYVPTNRVSWYMKQKLAKMKEEIGKSTIIVWYFVAPLSGNDRKIEKKNRRLKHYELTWFNWHL